MSNSTPVNNRVAELSVVVMPFYDSKSKIFNLGRNAQFKIPSKAVNFVVLRPSDIRDDLRRQASCMCVGGRQPAVRGD